MREFPGSPAGRTLHFHCRGRVPTLVGELTSCKLLSVAKSINQSIKSLLKQKVTHIWVTRTQNRSLQGQIVSLSVNDKFNLPYYIKYWVKWSLFSKPRDESYCSGRFWCIKFWKVCLLNKNQQHPTYSNHLQCFSNFILYMNHLGILLNCRHWFRRSAEEPEILHTTVF